MSEYWVSRKTWTCKYCNLTINDDVPSRLQHENGMRHKGNVERALKDVYRKSENDRREKRNLEIEMKKINRAAEASYAADLAGQQVSTSAEPSSSNDESKDPGPPPPPPPSSDNKDIKKPKPKDPYFNYTTAESLGYSEDPEVIRQNEEAEQRKQEGFAGEWEEVAPARSSISVTSNNNENRKVSTAAQQLAQALPPSERQKAREFKVREKAFERDGDEDDGLGEIKVRKRIKIESNDEMIRREEENRKRMLPQWTSMRLQVRNENEASGSGTQNQTPGPTETSNGEASGSGRVKEELKVEEGEDPSTAEATSAPAIEVKKEEGSPAADSQENGAGTGDGGGSSEGGGMFKKRRPRAGATKKVRALA